MLHGALPSREKNENCWLGKNLQASPSNQCLFASNSPNSISTRIQRLLARMLEPNPERRVDLDKVSMQLKIW
jgi:hypothetical protein